MKDPLEEILNDKNLSDEQLTKRQYQILEAAIKVFSEKGFEGSRTSEIAKEANVSEGTIFRYYKTKKDLLMGLVIPIVSRLVRPYILSSMEAIINASEEKSADEIVKEIFIDRLNLFKKNYPLLKTVIIESAYHPELLELLNKEIAPKIVPTVEKMIQRMMDSHKIKKTDPMLVARIMLSLIAGYIVFSSAFPEFVHVEDDEKEMEKLSQIFLHGIANTPQDK